MGVGITEEGRLRAGRGTGTGASYKPWIKIRDYNSTGTASSFPDWKHGRMVELLSQAELWAYVVLRWNDDIADIREHYPLDKDITSAIAAGFGYRNFANGSRFMTTDFLITMNDGSYRAVSVKPDRTSFTRSKREVERNYIEYIYWRNRGIPWTVIYKEDLDPVYVRNIRNVIAFYDIKRVQNDFGFIRYLIAHKEICVDLHKTIDFKALITQLKGGEVWKNTESRLGLNIQTKKD